MARSKFREGDHVVHKRTGAHGDVKEVIDSVGTMMPVVQWRGGDKETVYEMEITGTRQCAGRNGCSQS